MMFQDLIDEYQINQALLPPFLQDKITWFHSLKIQVKQSALVVEKKVNEPIKVDWSKLTKAKMDLLERDLSKRWKHEGGTLCTREFLERGLLVYKSPTRSSYLLCFQRYKGIPVSKSLYDRVDLPTSWDEAVRSQPVGGGVDAELEALLEEADKALCLALLVYLKDNPGAIDELIGQGEPSVSVYRDYYDSILAICPDLHKMTQLGNRVLFFTGASNVNPSWRVELKYFSEYQTEGCVYALISLFINQELDKQFVIIVCGDTVEPVIARSVDHGEMDTIQKYNPYDDGKLLRENTQLINSRFAIFLNDLKSENLRFGHEQIKLSGVIQQMLVELT